jgi:RNA 2',3'-cyclic 3'-phosphodiesterase
MTSPTSVGGDERIRLFLALRLPDDAIDGIVRWQAESLAGVRAVAREALHVTLAFLGRRPARELDSILDELRAAAAAAAPDLRLTPTRYRETRSVAMLVLDDEGGRAAALAVDVQERLERLGVYRRESRPWLPHLTVARFREPPRLGLEPPDMGTCVLVPSDAAAYLSQLHPDGARYEILESVALGGE